MPGDAATFWTALSAIATSLATITALTLGASSLLGERRRRHNSARIVAADFVATWEFIGAAISSVATELKEERNNLTDEHSEAFVTLLSMEQVKKMLELDIPALGALINRRDCVGMALAFGGLRRLYMQLLAIDAAISANDQDTIDLYVAKFVDEADLVVAALDLVHERLAGKI
ncbi:hypothetical protein DBL07_25940 [Achromobacter mucicolens]|nr:hypothetical protein DBL07_25940 [Achromobacter mucicolens]